MQELRQGAHGFQVQYLQRLLNRAGANPHVREDGVFGPRTHAGVVAFQTARRLLPANGFASRAVLNALGFRLEIEHPVRSMGQPTGMTCWSAAMTMMRGTNMSIGPGGARLAADGGLQTTRENIGTFARQNALRIVSEMQSIPVPQFIELLRRGPLMAIGAGAGWAHASVISGIYSDGNPDASGTMIRIHDPWPPGSPGRVYGVFYSGGRQVVPGATYNLFGAYLLGN